MLIALCSAKGSPGVTTTLVAIGAGWPREVARPVLLEADPAGGDLGARFLLGPTPGLVSLATAVRSGRDRPEVDLRVLGAHCQFLPGGLGVISAPVSAASACAAVAMLATTGAGLIRAAATDPGTVLLVDVGRIEPRSSALGLLAGASAVLLVTGTRVEDLAHAATVLPLLPRWTTHPGLLLVGSGYPASEVHRQLGVPVLATVPHDPAGVAVLCGRPAVQGIRTSAVGKAATGLAHQLFAFLHPTSTHSGARGRTETGTAHLPGSSAAGPSAAGDNGVLS